MFQTPLRGRRSRETCLQVRWMGRAAGAIALASALLATTGAFTPASAQSDGVELVGYLDVGGPYNEVWGYSAPDGTELAILGTTAGTHFVDVTVPSEPNEVGFVPGEASTWRDMKTYSHYAYSVNESGGGLQIIDLEDPLDPILVNVRQVHFTTAHNIFIDEGAGTLWVVGANSGSPRSTYVYALEPDPSSPDLITDWDGTYFHDIFVRDGLAYGAALYNGELWILDVSELPVIEVLSAIETPGSFTHNTWVTDDGRYCLTTDENPGGHVGIYDVQDPTDPQYVAEWSNPDGPRTIVHNAFVQGGYAYVSWYTAGLQIIDLEDPSAPTRAGYYDTYPGTSSSFDGAWGVYPFARSGYTYISDISTGLYIVRFDQARSRASGSVLAAGGGPLEGVEVTVSGFPETAVTGAAGEYSLHLLPGDYELTYSLFGWDSVTEPITLGRSAQVLPDVVMSSIPRGSVEGILRDVRGVPVADAIVKMEGSPFETRTGADGRFLLEDVPSGERILSAEAFGLSAEPTTFRVEAGTTTGAELVAFVSLYRNDFEEAASAWTVGGPDDGATAGVWSLAGDLAAVTSSSQPMEDHSAVGSQAFVTERGEPGSSAGDHDVDGGTTTLTSPGYDLRPLERPVVTFHLWYVNGSDLQPDDEFVVEGSPDGGTTWTELYRTGDGLAEWRQVEIGLGPEFHGSSDFRIRFLASDLGDPSLVEAGLDDFELFDARGRITGRLVSAGSGRTLLEGSVVNDATGDEVTVAVGDDGRFEMLAPPGELTLRVRGFGHEESVLAVSVAARRTLTRDLVLTPMPSRSVVGRVLARDGGSPLPGATVTCLGTPLTTVTDGEGRFELEVPIGEYSLRVTTDDFGSVDRVIHVTESEGPITLEIGLTASFLTSVDPVFPNPSRGDAVLQFRLARSDRVRLDVFDITGRRIRVVWDGTLGVGEHELRWDGRSDRGDRVPAGLYFQRFRADGLDAVQRVVRFR